MKIDRNVTAKLVVPAGMTGKMFALTQEESCWLIVAPSYDDALQIAYQYMSKTNGIPMAEIKDFYGDSDYFLADVHGLMT